jgi:hypothetical protein
MFSKVLAKLTGIFLILYISATSAMPNGQPEEAQNINDDIHARQQDDNLCPLPYVWIRRECLGSVGLTDWQDVCAKSSSPTQLDFSIIKDRRGNCPANTYCMNVFNVQGSRTNRCVSTAQAKGEQKLDDPQVGVSDWKRAETRLGNTQVQYSVTIDHDMAGASVAAVFQSECRVHGHISLLTNKFRH